MSSSDSSSVSMSVSPEVGSPPLPCKLSFDGPSGRNSVYAVWKVPKNIYLNSYKTIQWPIDRTHAELFEKCSESAENVSSPHKLNIPPWKHV